MVLLGPYRTAARPSKDDEAEADRAEKKRILQAAKSKLLREREARRREDEQERIFMERQTRNCVTSPNDRRQKRLEDPKALQSDIDVWERAYAASWLGPNVHRPDQAASAADAALRRVRSLRKGDD